MAVTIADARVDRGKGNKEFRGVRISKFPFYIYSNKLSISYFALSGYLGDVVNIKILKVEDPYSFKKCMRIAYKPTFEDQNYGWAGIFWQWPPNNWGDNDRGGYDLSKARFLYFYARGSKGNELIEFKIGGVKGPYGDSDEATSGIIALSKKWKLYKIDLRKKDLKNIIGGFAVLFQSHLNQDGATVYLNDVYYTKKLKPEPKFFKDYLQLKASDKDK
ncbi:MAG: hypothetical protein KKH98_15890 [Spirochaetes bacterium]|nr:hypothetical protein [Spirochaetota bacterium]